PGDPVAATVRGRNRAAPNPTRPTTPSAAIASPYERSGVVVIPATRMVPAIAVPKDDPRLDTLRESPEISPWRLSPKLDCTTLTEGVSMSPRPSPIRSRPETKRHTAGEPVTRASS